jgi:hypothetical protein
MPWIPSSTRRMDVRAADEDSKLKGAVQRIWGQGLGSNCHAGCGTNARRKDWAAIAALVPGRTTKSSWNRWKQYMKPNRSSVRGKEHGNLSQAPVAQDPHSPRRTMNSCPEIPLPGTLPSMVLVALNDGSIVEILTHKKYKETPIPSCSL